MNPTAASTAYVGEAGRAYHEGKRALPEVAVPWVVRARADLFQPFLQPDHSVLEWGCGFGWNLAGLRCARRTGYDVAVQLESVVRAAGIEFVADPTHLPKDAFDVVICHHALEHVPDPLAVLETLRRVLKAGGTLLLAVPFEKERRYRRFDPQEPNHHLFSWNVQTLGNLLGVAGWDLRSLGLRAYGYDRRAALLAVRFRLGERGFRGLRAALRILFPLREVAAVAVPVSRS